VTEIDEPGSYSPAGLGNRAKRLWDGVSTAYELRVDELVILEEACHEVDLLDRIDARLRLGTLTMRGAFGAVVAHPLLAEVRQHRGVLARLLGQLKLPEAVGKPEWTASDKARRAAAARWGNGGA
jgi:hypothetical protein